MSRSLIVAALALGLSFAPSPALAELPDGVQVEKKVKAKKVERTFLGTWNVELPADAMRSLEIARGALTGQDMSALAHLDLTEDEQASFAMLQMMLLSEGAEEQRTEMLRELDAAANGMSFTVSETSLGVKLGDDTTEAAWTKVRTGNNLLVISATMEGEGVPSEINIHFLDRDRVVLTGEGNDPIFLTRAD